MMCIPRSTKSKPSQGFIREKKTSDKHIKVTRKSYLRGDSDFIDERKKAPKKKVEENSWINTLFS